MENMTEALKMAFAVLMFVLALGLSISSFSQARETVDALITLRDRQTDYTYVQQTQEGNREVSGETIIPTLYKAYKENFEVRFYDENGDELILYNYWDPNGKPIGGISTIDLSNETHSSREQLIADLSKLLNGDDVDRRNANGDLINNERKECVNLNYEYLTEHTFIETIGEYYQEDKKSLEERKEAIENGEDYEEKDIAETNKTKKRVITYTLHD